MLANQLRETGDDANAVGRDVEREGGGGVVGFDQGEVGVEEGKGMSLSSWRNTSSSCGRLPMRSLAKASYSSCSGGRMAHSRIAGGWLRPLNLQSSCVSVLSD